MDMKKVPVPPIGLTKKYPDVGTGPCKTDIYHDPEIYKKELEAVWKPSWFMIGRVDLIPEPGDFFVYDMPTFRYSLLIVRDKDGNVNGFHNVCTHRGNVVEHRACGKSPRFVCRFHGWAYDQKGECVGIRDQEGFFGLDKKNMGLKRVALEVWNGFIFVSPQDKPEKTLAEYLGQQGLDTAAYDWNACTQSYKFEVEIDCNWKLIVDSFAEVYHIPCLHPNSAAPTLMASGNPYGRLLDVELKGPHRTNAHYTVQGKPTPLQTLAYMHAGAAQNTVAWKVPGMNHTGSENWSVDLVIFFPALSFTVAAGAYTAHQVWPLAANKCLYQQTVFMRPAKNAAERFGQENTMVEYRDIVMEDLSTLERIQRALDTGQIKEFHYHDHELALRHQHKVVTDLIADYEKRQAAKA
jgi:phenylpropionate dioxygenase-like ring-hydroxylating dioxygenase large terminal subunit